MLATQFTDFVSSGTSLGASSFVPGGKQGGSALVAQTTSKVCTVFLGSDSEGDTGGVALLSTYILGHRTPALCKSVART